MKNNNRMFILTEAILAAALLLTAVAMLRERNERALDRVAVILQDPNDSRYAAFKYGLQAAAQDYGAELVMMSTEERFTAEEVGRLLERAVESGASAAIVQPAADGGIREVLDTGSQRIPIMQVGCKTDEAADLPVTEPDNYDMGAELARELLADCGGDMDGKTIGLVSQAGRLMAEEDREKGFSDTLSEEGARVLWSFGAASDEAWEQLLTRQPAVDFIVAMDDISLVAAGKEASSNDLHGALVYGIGHSTEAIYYLDTGKVQRLVVPDTFHLGYQSLAEVKKKLDNRFYKMQDRRVSYTVLCREELFSKENQEILFTMSQ